VWKHGREIEASEARHRAMLMARYSIILGLERLYKPTTWSVEPREHEGLWGYEKENGRSVKGVIFRGLTP
jgi:hypothetical protein